MDAVASRFASSFFIVFPRLRSTAANDSLQNIRENKTFRERLLAHQRQFNYEFLQTLNRPFSQRITFFDVTVVTLKYTSKIIFEFRTSIERLHDARELRELDYHPDR